VKVILLGLPGNATQGIPRTEKPVTLESYYQVILPRELPNRETSHT
jgi:hypothetical protein